MMSLTPVSEEEIREKFGAPWEGKCVKACWFAQEVNCTCRCGGLYHGRGLVPHLPAEEEKKFKAGLNLTCGWCQTDLSGVPIEHYDHDGGYEVPGYEKKQWLYITCPKCHYQWALWKLRK
jgi:hypothetical protein